MHRAGPPDWEEWKGEEGGNPGPGTACIRYENMYVYMGVYINIYIYIYNMEQRERERVRMRETGRAVESNAYEGKKGKWGSRTMEKVGGSAH
jgi:hypothetical protein